MNLEKIIAKDLDGIITERGDAMLTWMGEDYRCSASGTSNSKELEAGGFGLEQNNSFTVVKADFNGIYPREQDKITYKNVKYRIKEVIYDGNNAFIRLICAFENY